jgi:hypothetical protein
VPIRLNSSSSSFSSPLASPRLPARASLLLLTYHSLLLFLLLQLFYSSFSPTPRYLLLTLSRSSHSSLSHTLRTPTPPSLLLRSAPSLRFTPRALLTPRPVIVAGHTGCGGCIAAHASPLPTETSSSPLMRFLDPVIRLRHSLGEKADVDELIVANVKRNVQNVIDSPVSGV